MPTTTDPFNADGATRIVFTEISDETIGDLEEQFPVAEGEEPSVVAENSDGETFELGDIFVTDTFVFDSGATITTTTAIGQADDLAELGFDAASLSASAGETFASVLAEFGRDVPTLDFEVSVPTSLFDFGDFGF